MTSERDTREPEPPQAKDYLISQYPVRRDYLQRVSAMVGKPLEPVIVSAITAKGYLKVLRHFRDLSAEAIFIPVIDPSGRPLLAPLELLSMLVRTRKRQIVEPDLSLHDFGVVDAFLAGVRMAWGTVHGFATALGSWFRLRGLLAVPRVRLGEGTVNRAVYLKTNLWLGIQAGGSVAHTSGVINGLMAKGYEIDFASVEPPIALRRRDALRFVPVVPRSTYIVPRELNHFRHNRCFVEDTSQTLGDPEGIIYQRLSLGNYAGVDLSRRHGLPLVIEYNGSETWLAKNWGTPITFEKLVRRAEDVCLRHAHVVVTVSDALKEELVGRGVDSERIVSCPNGVDPSVFDPGRFTAEDIGALKAQYAIPENSLVVTFVGTFGPWHGAEVFAESVVEMAARDPSWLDAHAVHFMFIGDGVRRAIVEDIIAEPATRRRVTITGLIDQQQTPVHLAAADILVSPHVRNPDGSPFFGSPTKLFEYLASGRPVIGSDLGQIGEVLAGCPHVSDLDGADAPSVNGVCGLLIEPERPSELAASVRFLVDNPDWREAAGRNARRRALDRYTWDHHVAEILQGLQRVRALDAVPAKPRLRLLFNGLHSKSGGGLTYLHNALPQIAADPEVAVHLCVHEDQRDQLPDNTDDITVHYLDFPQGFWRLLIAEQTDIPRLAKRIGAEATFSPANYGPIAAPNSVILLRNALSVAFVERRPAKLLYWVLVYLGTLLSILVSRHVITVSEYARRAASGGLIGLFSDRFTVIPHGVSGIFSPPKKGAKRDHFLLAVSDLYVQKNLKNLINAVARLQTDHPGITLKIAGRPLDMEYFDVLKRTVAEEKLDGKIEFLGGVSPKELVQLYRRCGVFVFPSTVETFGNPLVEAMACGAPIASSRTAAMPEVLGDAGVFFDPRDADDMAAAIGRLLKDDKLRRELSRKAVTRAGNFSWERTAERTLAVIKEAASPQ